MLVKTYGSALSGIDAITVTIETNVDRGVYFCIVGLPDTAVKESSERVKSAIKESGYTYPVLNIVINMAPADVRKEGAAYDLPIAISILAASQQIQVPDLHKYIIMGELSLDGTVQPIGGILPMAIAARNAGFKGMIVPQANATEAAVVNNLEIYGVDNLRQVVQFLTGELSLQPTVVNTREQFAAAQDVYDLDFCDVKGQENVKRAFEIACSGGHNILLVGPPGAGKSMMAKRLPSIMPPLSLHEALETTKIHSVAGRLKGGSTLMTTRPFRSPHHTISPVALVGGGSNPMPGEISLAHNGILFLDEFPEFSRQVLEVLRQPLEDRHITISRAKYTIDYPAGFMLVASMNPCPCGYYNHPTRECTCPAGAVTKYLGKISGPLLNRIDIQCEILPVPFEKLRSMEQGERSENIRRRVVKARHVQTHRFRDEKGIHSNSQMNSRMMRTYAPLSPECMKVLEYVMDKFDMSARAYDRIVKVARTIADLEYSANLPEPTDSNFATAVAAAADGPILPQHIREAISYRKLDRSSWGRTFS